MKQYKLGLILGRFQGVHKGHESIINQALELCENVLIFVGSSDKSGTKDNPFSYDLRYELLNKIYGEKIKIYPLPDLGVGNVPKWGDYVIENAKKVIGKPNIIIYGEEPKCNTWFKNYPDISYISVDRSIVNINASKLREIILLDNKELFENYTNQAIHDLYPILREQLIKSQK